MSVFNIIVTKVHCCCKKHVRNVSDRLYPLDSTSGRRDGTPALRTSAFPLPPFCNFRLCICSCSFESHADLGVNGISVELRDKSLAAMTSIDPEAMCRWLIVLLKLFSLQARLFEVDKDKKKVTEMTALCMTVICATDCLTAQADELTSPAFHDAPNQMYIVYSV